LKRLDLGLKLVNVTKDLVQLVVELRSTHRVIDQPCQDSRRRERWTYQRPNIHDVVDTGDNRSLLRGTTGSLRY
jgi:hypothetical protein